MINVQPIAIDPKIIEAVVLTCLEKAPIDFRGAEESEVKRVTATIKRATTPNSAAFKYRVTRRHFLCGCLDFTDSLPEEHLIVGYGHCYGNTTDIERVHHIIGEQRRVSVPMYVREEIRRHHFHRSDAEVIVFHNHPRTGHEPEWFYTLKSRLQDLPIASHDDRRELQHHAFTSVGLFRQFFGQGQVRFFLGESGFVEEFRLPPILPFSGTIERTSGFGRFTMSKSQQGTGGGTATHAGTNYQNRVAAWSAVMILAEQSAVPPWSLPDGVTLESLHAETPHAVDDLAVQTSVGGSVLSQAKHTLSLQSSAASPFGSAISQVVREYRAAKPPLDAAKDRLVIVTTSLSTAPVKTHLPAFLNRFRSSPAPEQEWTEGNSQENDAAATLREHLTRAWRDETGADPVPADIVAILKLTRIQILDVDEDGQSEREAKQLLRTSILAAPTQADASWNTLITATAGYAANAQRADRAALQRVLTDAGIEIIAARSFQDDVRRLRDHTAATLRGLTEFSRIHADGKTVVIQRAASSDVHAAASAGHLLVLGMPGAGKSGVLHHLANELRAQGADVVLFAVDQIEAASIGALRAELSLKHELLAVLSAWPGTAPGYLIIDALDAARSDSAVKTLQTIIREITSAPGRWHVVASVRKFDLRYDPALQRLFKGTPASMKFTDAEFGLVRHVNVPILSDDELAQISAQSSVLGALVSGAPPQLRELLHLPFNLRLLAELLDAGMTQEELKPVRTQIELLDRYWQERIIRRDHQGDAREVVLRRVVKEMVARRALRIARIAAVDNDAASGAFLNDLLSTHVLAEWTTQSGAAQRDFLTFPHHHLFDYAAARLFVPPEAALLLELLSREADLLIAIRPSIELHFQRLWHQDQAAFWDLTFRILESPLNEVGKLLGPIVAALLAITIGDTQQLLECLRDSQRHATGIAALRHILSTLLTYGLTAGLVGPGPWAEFLDIATTVPTPELAHSIRPYVNFLAENFGALDGAAAGHVAILMRRLLNFSLTTTPFNALMAVNAIVGVTKTIATDPVASIAVLRQCITKDHLAEHGFRTFPTLARQATVLVGVDPVFVRDLYIAGFTHQEKSDEKTLMGDSQILPMSSNRRQDYEMGQWSLAEQFPHILQIAPRDAVAALLVSVESYVANRRKAVRDIVPVVLEGKDSGLWRDNSFIWDSGASQIENVPKMIQAFENFLGSLTDITLLRGLLDDIVASKPPGTILPVAAKKCAILAGRRAPASRLRPGGVRDAGCCSGRLVV